jgi:hypothetical protein
MTTPPGGQFSRNLAGGMTEDNFYKIPNLQTSMAGECAPDCIYWRLPDDCKINYGGRSSTACGSFGWYILLEVSPECVADAKVASQHEKETISKGVARVDSYIAVLKASWSHVRFSSHEE